MANPIYITTQSNSDEGGEFTSLYFDAVHSFTPNFNSRMTQYALSDKSSITNNKVKENIKINMSATVTATPVTKYNNNLVGYSDFNERPKNAYDILYDWWKKDVDLFIDEGNRQFSKMQITSLSPAENGYDSITFDVSFEQARRVGYQRVTLAIPLDEDKAKDGEGNKSEKGEKSTERVPQTYLLVEDLIRQSDLLLNLETEDTESGG